MLTDESRVSRTASVTAAVVRNISGSTVNMSVCIDPRDASGVATNHVRARAVSMVRLCLDISDAAYKPDAATTIAEYLRACCITELAQLAKATSAKRSATKTVIAMKLETDGRRNNRRIRFTHATAVVSANGWR